MPPPNPCPPPFGHCVLSSVSVPRSDGLTFRSKDFWEHGGSSPLSSYEDAAALITWVWWLSCVCHPLSLDFLSLPFLSHHTLYCISASNPAPGTWKALDSYALGTDAAQMESLKDKGHTKCYAD